jgi:alanine racemase
MRGTRLEINLESVKNNLLKIQSLLPDTNKTIAIVKADAYGLGAVKISNYISDLVWAFGVATLEEAIELRNNNITKKIIMLSPFFENEINEIIDYSITPTITDSKRAEILSKHLKTKNQNLNIHIKIDTGMGRLGLGFDECIDEIINISKTENITIEGIFSHFPSADLLDDTFCAVQIKRFQDTIDTLKKSGVSIPVKHIANSAGIAAYKESHFDAVRPGILLYGTYPSLEIKEIIKVDNVATLKAKILFIKKVKQGETVSYGRTFIAERETRVGVVGIGYADGFSTLNSSKAFLYVNGRFTPVLGRVCMDYTMIDLTNLAEAKEGDDVVIFGNGGEPVDYYAEKAGIIAYEALTGVSKRVPRFYI